MKPTIERPHLVGILVDVSGSMTSSIENNNGDPTSRLESFQDSLEKMVKKAATLSLEESKEKIAPLVKVFAYGFGFGGLIASFFGGDHKKVRDLLKTSLSNNSTVSIDELANNWLDYKRHFEKLVLKMFGETPMKEGFEIAYARFKNELQSQNYTDEPVLFVLSDGIPTDADEIEVIEIANKIKELGVTIISCYVTDQDITEVRTLYTEAQTKWPEGAALMLECSSTLNPKTSFFQHLNEFNWSFNDSAKLFSQVNQSEILSEFLEMVLSPIENNTHEPNIIKNAKSTNVFVSYSHNDSKYLEKGALIDYLSGLKNENINFWFDKSILAGDNWNEEIITNMEKADIALVLVSQSFLNSQYCMDVEIKEFIRKRKEDGLVIFPIILSHCDWKSHDWLSETQFEPREGQTIELDFEQKGKRDKLYLSIYEQLRLISESKR